MQWQDIEQENSEYNRRLIIVCVNKCMRCSDVIELSMRSCRHVGGILNNRKKSVLRNGYLTKNSYTIIGYSRTDPFRLCAINSFHVLRAGIKGLVYTSNLS